MTLLSYAIYFAVLVGLAWLVAAWMARVYAGTLSASARPSRTARWKWQARSS